MRKTNIKNQIRKALQRIDNQKHNKYRIQLDEYSRAIESASENKINIDIQLRDYL